MRHLKNRLCFPSFRALHEYSCSARLSSALALAACCALFSSATNGQAETTTAIEQASDAAKPIPNADAKTVASVRAECAAKAKAAEKAYSIAVAGRDGWLFFAPELRHVGAGKFWGEDAARVSQSSLEENADPLPAILDFKKQLDRAGIELLMVPVPPKAAIYPDKISSLVKTANGIPPRIDTSHQEFYDLLRQSGVAVLDLTSDFLLHRLDSEGAVYCRQDTHWSGRACVFAARRIAATTEASAWRKSMTRREYAQNWKRVQITGDMWPSGGKTKTPKETLPLRFITAPDTGQSIAAKPHSTPQTSGMSTHVAGAIPFVAIDAKSPVLLLGDSHDLVFHEGGDMHARGAGLADQLAFELGFPVDLIAVRGSGATPARTNLMRRSRANPNYLKGKKLIVWCFSAREFTESAGWNLVPVVK